LILTAFFHRQEHSTACGAMSTGKSGTEAASRRLGDRIIFTSIATKGEGESNADTDSDTNANSQAVHRHAQGRPDASPDSDAQRQRLGE
jgi:hypothetical protein